MTETTQEAAAVTPAASAEQDQAAKGAQKVDPLTAVENAATKEQRTDSSFLDTLTPEQRRAAEKYIESRNSKAINEALKSKTEKGEYLTSEQVEAKMRRMMVEERESFQKKLEGREAFYNHLAEYGIVPGTPDYAGFETEFKSGAYNPDAIGRKEVVERIARIAGVGRFRKQVDLDTKSPYLGTAGVSLKTLQDQKTTGTTGDKMLDDAREMLNKVRPS